MIQTSTIDAKKLSPNVAGVAFLVLGMLIFSLQDIAVKWIGGDYPVLEIVTFRSLTAMPLTLLLFPAVYQLVYRRTEQNAP